MTDHPMIFSAPMVRALIEGRKTQTRRAMTPSNTLFNGEAWGAVAKRQTWDWAGAWVDAGPSPVGNPGPYLKLPWLAGDADIYGDTVHRIYPRTQPGDRIWVKETFTRTQHGKAVYRADAHDQAGDRWPSIVPGDPDGEVLWRPSMFMPRWASRLTLTVTGVRVQRVQEISRGDAMAEGCPFQNMAEGLNPQGWFADLWDSLNAKRGHAWSNNPWVAALRFTVRRGNIDAGGAK